MKIYLASKYGLHPVMRIWRDELESHGYTVTSRWINGDHEQKEGDFSDHDFNHRMATEDLEDVDKADVLVLYQPKEILGQGKGGRHVEFGFALSRRKLIIIVGERENVFNYRKGVICVESFQVLIPTLHIVKNVMQTKGWFDYIEDILIEE